MMSNLEGIGTWFAELWANPPYFQTPLYFFVGLAVAAAFVYLRHRRQPRLAHSNVSIHDNLKGSPLGLIPTLLFALSLFMLAVAAGKPVRDFTVETMTRIAHQIVFGVDYSGSMDGTDVPGAAQTLMPEGLTGCQNMEHPDDNKPDESRTSMRRINAACFAVTNFVLHRPGDRIGIMMFNQSATWLLPLWWDHDVIVQTAQRINLRGTSGGTNFEGPTRSNPQLGPLQLGYNHLTRYAQGTHGWVMIMVTDGDDSISEERREQFTQMYREAGIHLYVLGIGSGWADGKNPDLKKLVDAVEGRVFPITDGNSLRAALEEIDRLEASEIRREVTTDQAPLYPVFLFLAAVFALLYLFAAAATAEPA